MRAANWPVVTTAPKREIADALPGWLGAWWGWTMRGLDEWRVTDGAVGRCLIAAFTAGMLALVAVIALVGHACRALVQGRAA